MRSESIEENLIHIFTSLKNSLSKNGMRSIDDFISHGEWGLAFETLCIEIYDREIPISQELFNKIVFLGKLMNIDEEFFITLNELVK